MLPTDEGFFLRIVNNGQHGVGVNYEKLFIYLIRKGFIKRK
jgi:hypothetical protein